MRKNRLRAQVLLDMYFLQVLLPYWHGKYHVKLLTPGLTFRNRIGEKFLEWSDEEPSLDSILTNVSLYWFTSSYPTSICKRKHVPIYIFHANIGLGSLPRLL
jgi:hypothetical protein